MESPENDSACFPPFPQTLEIARKVHRETKIMRSDSHIPSAPATASMNRIQIPKGQNPLRLPFASFRLIFGLEKTLRNSCPHKIRKSQSARFGVHEFPNPRNSCIHPSLNPSFMKALMPANKTVPNKT